MEAAFQVPVSPMIYRPPVDLRIVRPHRHSQDWRPGMSGPAMSTAEMYARIYKIPLIGYGISGLGATITGGAAQADQIASAGAESTVAILTALGTFGAGPVGAAIGAAIGGLIALAGMIASMFGGCGQTCIQASNIANQVEPVLKQNLQQYLAAPVHYKSLQTAALNNFGTAWAALDKACSNPALQAAGQHCISDRIQGSCHYTTSPGGWSNGVYTYPGQEGSGSSCWNWYVGYRSPISDDPTVVPDPPSPSGSVSGSGGGLFGSGSGSSLMPLLLLGGAAVVLVIVLN
jgi:hypothetical protein